MGYAIEGEIFIPEVEWHKFVMSYAPQGPGEVKIGPVEVVGGDLSVKFAANTECPPTSFLGRSRG